MPEGIRVIEAYEPQRKASELKWQDIKGVFEYDERDKTAMAAALEEFFARDAIVITKKTKRGMGESDIRPAIKTIGFTVEDGGVIVEEGTPAQIFYEHKHPYTEALLRSLPSADAGKREPLMSIPGTPPDLLCPPKGCGFAARCRHCMQICHEEQPPEFDVGGGHMASCWLLHPDCPCAAERGDDQ